jgi:hypothetical protein
LQAPDRIFVWAKLKVSRPGHRCLLSETLGAFIVKTLRLQFSGRINPMPHVRDNMNETKEF